MFCCCRKKKDKVIVQFYKMSFTELVNQLKVYMNDIYKTDGNITGSYLEDKYSVFVYENDMKHIYVVVKTIIVENKLNYRMSVCEITNSF